MDHAAAFEARLHDAWQARDFAAWAGIRLVYADWLEENDLPLWRMARCPLRVHQIMVHSSVGKRPWQWRLYFDLPADWGRPRARWWANRRVNGKQLLGLPPFTLRCKGWQDDTRTLRFTAQWKPHTEKRFISARRFDQTGGRWQTVARDTDLHPQGFAAAFWSMLQGVLPERTPGQKTLFD